MTGGAGYESQTVRLLVKEGHRVTVVDNLSTGHAALPSEVNLVEASLVDGAMITKSLEVSTQYYTSPRILGQVSLFTTLLDFG